MDSAPMDANIQLAHSGAPRGSAVFSRAWIETLETRPTGFTPIAQFPWVAETGASAPRVINYAYA
jgi:hypothetical protein